MVREAPICSAANPAASASVSCAMRERSRTPRAASTNGSTMSGMAMRTRLDSLGLETVIITSAPIKSTMLRSAMEALAPKADLISVVSAVRRETISPALAVS